MPPLPRQMRYPGRMVFSSFSLKPGDTHWGSETLPFPLHAHFITKCACTVQWPTFFFRRGGGTICPAAVLSGPSRLETNPQPLMHTHPHTHVRACPASNSLGDPLPGSKHPRYPLPSPTSTPTSPQGSSTPSICGASGLTIDYIWHLSFGLKAFRFPRYLPKNIKVQVFVINDNKAEPFPK